MLKKIFLSNCEEVEVTFRVDLLHKGIFLNLYKSRTIINILNSKGYYGLEMWLCEAQNNCLENFVGNLMKKVTLYTKKKMED